MSCAVDPIAWGEKNRVSLRTGKRHEWVLARTSRDNPSTSSLAETARAVMVKWFRGIPLDVLFADAGDVVDDIQVQAVTTEAPAPTAGAERRENLDPLPLLASGPSSPLYVKLSFNYRGYQKSLPWPVWTANNLSLLRESKLCPFDCDWMLLWGKDPSKLADAGEEASFLDKLAKHGPGPLSDLAALMQLAGWGIVLYGGLKTARLFGIGRRS